MGHFIKSYRSVGTAALGNTSVFFSSDAGGKQHYIICHKRNLSDRIDVFSGKCNYDLDNVKCYDQQGMHVES